LLWGNLREIGNALSAIFKRGMLSLDQARQLLAQFAEMPIRRTELRLAEAVEIAFSPDISQ